MIQKKADVETLKTLRGECEFLFAKIDSRAVELNEHIAKMPQKAFVIASAYTLSSIYSCYEDMFKHIAKVFENRIENLSSWHSELLKRMIIEVPEIRSAVLTEKVIVILDEMRSFRHVFRNSYVFVIDADRVLVISKRWNVAKDEIKKEIMDFLKKIDA